MAFKYVEILNGDNDPPLPFVIIDRVGHHVDLSQCGGELFDPPTTSRIIWGIRSPTGQTFGRVELKNGESRTFWDEELIWPYVKAYDLVANASD